MFLLYKISKHFILKCLVKKKEKKTFLGQLIIKQLYSSKDLITLKDNIYHTNDIESISFVN